MDDLDFLDQPDDRLEQNGYAQVILSVIDRAPLLGTPRLAALVDDCLRRDSPPPPGQVWGWLVMPATLRLVVGPTGLDALDDYVIALKTRLEDRLLAAIRRADDDSLDMVLRYNPVWGGALYHVWQAGYHRQFYFSEYRLSNALYELQQIPVQAGLVASPDRWPYLWLSGAEA